MKKLTGLATAAVLAVAVAGCSNPGGGDVPSTEDASGEITYMVWDANQVPALEQNIADFNELYPDVTVNLDVTPWAQYWTKLQTQAEGGTLADVFWMNGPNFELYASNGLIEPLDGLVEAGAIDPANYPDIVADSYTYDGTLYGVPKDYTTVVMYYNKAVFDRAGVDLPTSEWTWDDFREASVAISDALASEGVYGAVMPYSGQSAYYNTIFQADGFVISDDKKSSGFGEPEAIEGLQYLADLVADGGMPSPAQVADTPAVKWYVSGKAAMYWSGTWSIAEVQASDVAADTDLIDLPTGEVQATNVLGLANVISAESKNPDAAAAFAAYLGSEEAQRTQGALGAANPAFIGAGDSFIDFVPEWNLEVFVDSVDYARAYPVSRNTAEWNALEGELLAQAFSGERPVADVAKELASRMDELLAAE
jgi:multiple sugar transport system substrate-binding protein